MESIFVNKAKFARAQNIVLYGADKFEKDSVERKLYERFTEEGKSGEQLIESIYVGLGGVITKETQEPAKKTIRKTKKRTTKK